MLYADFAMNASSTLFGIENSWLLGAARHPSSNCDERVAGVPISLLVIHGISLPPNEFGGGYVEDLFLNRLDCTAHPYFAKLQGVKVSAHLFVRRTGEVLQFVPFNKRAWHAGQSSFQGRAACNDFSIGIELEGADQIPYEPLQYQRLAMITQLLMQHYPDIRRETIVGHSDIAPGRKTDPGDAFDWHHFFSLLEKSAENEQ